MQEVPSTAARSLHGEQAVLVEAARTLRSAVTLEVYRSHPLDEYAMSGAARLLEAIARSLHVGDDVHHAVVSAAMEIADHVMTYVLRVVRAVDGERTVGP